MQRFILIGFLPFSHSPILPFSRISFSRSPNLPFSFSPSLTVLLLLSLGCGDSNQGTVSGVVTLDGQPQTNLMVSFQPTGTHLNPGPGSIGRTNNQGEYRLKTVGGGSGASLGWHKVMIRSVTEGGGNVDIPAKYNTKSELKFEVKRGHNTADFKLITK
jgi:hypothetical protein